MRLIKIFTVLFTVGIFSIACEKGGENNIEAQETETLVSTAEAKAKTIIDENGWYHDWDAGLETAIKEKKPVLVDFYADWCKWCHVMDDSTFSDPEIKKKFASDWITVRLDTEDSETMGTYMGKTMVYRQLSREIGISGLPSYLFFNSSGEPVSIDGDLAIIPGYIPKEYFSIILDYFKNELYSEGINLQDHIQSTM